MTSTNRRHVLHMLATAVGMAALPAMAAAPAKIAMEVWKDPNCGCCKDWIALIEQAGFAVLKAPDIPSILVETAFISNPEEERRLNDDAYQDKMAEAILSGMRKYFAKNPPLAKSTLARLD